MKKFLLVPQTQLPSPLTHKLTQLDEEMKSTLERNDLGEHSKAMLYSQILDKYLNVRRQLEAPKPITLVDEAKKPKLNVDTDVFAKNYRQRARNLLKHIEGQSPIQWNEKGELLVRDVALPGSNIVDLVDDLIRKKDGAPPVGSETFVDMLRQSNVPQTMIGNKTRMKAVQLPVVTPPPRSPPRRLTDSRGATIATRGRGRGRMLNLDDTPGPQRGSGIRWESL